MNTYVRGTVCCSVQFYCQRLLVYYCRRACVRTERGTIEHQLGRHALGRLLELVVYRDGADGMRSAEDFGVSSSSDWRTCPGFA